MLFMLWQNDVLHCQSVIHVTILSSVLLLLLLLLVLLLLLLLLSV
jgi:hypothetical protein